MTSEVRISSQRSEVNYSFSLLITTYMAIFPRIIFGLLRHKYIPCNKHERKLPLAIKGKMVYEDRIPFMDITFLPTWNIVRYFSLVRILSSVIWLPHFSIRIFYHPHFVISILSSALRHPSPSGPRFTETLKDHDVFVFILPDMFHIAKCIWKTIGINTKIARHA